MGLKSRVVLCDPTPDYLLTCLSAEDDDSRSVMQLSSFYILSKWKELSAEEKLSFLAQLGFISQRENQQNQKNRNKSQKSLAEQSKYLECIQLEFTHWYSDLPQIQECIPLIAETDFEALEAGVFSQESTTQEKFVSWCNSHSNLGSELCEYVSYCPLIKLFSPAGIDPGFFWYRWATKAFSELEHMYNHHVGDSNLVALFSNDGAVVKNSKKAKIKKPQVKEIPSKKTETNGKKAKKPKNNRDSSVAKESKVEVSIAPIVLAQSKCVESIVEDRTIIDEEYLLLEQSNLPESSNFDNFAQFEHHTTNVEAATVERTTFDSTSRMDSDSLSSSSSKSEESFPPCQAQSDGEDLRDLTECSHQELEQKQEQELLRDNSQDMTSAVTTTNASPVEPEQKKNSDPKRNGGEFLGPECQIFSKKSKKIPTERTEKSVESQTDSHGRVDLIQWDQQRRLTEILTEDILDMASNLYKIAQLRRPWQSAAIERVRVAVQSIWPQAQCDIFGSFGTGLAIPSSDVDIVVTGIL